MVYWRWFILVLMLFGMGGGVMAQNTEMVSLKFPKILPDELLNEYERLTGKQLIRDATLPNQPLTVMVSKPIPKADAIKMIESVFLLNNIGIIALDENKSKVVSIATKPLRAEGVPFYANAKDLPEGEQVVSFFMPFRFLPIPEALPIFQQHVQVHPYGAIVAAPNASALIITENVPVIRELLKLRQAIDLPPEKWGEEMEFRLKYATVANVFDSLVSLLKEPKEGDPAAAAASAASSAASQTATTSTSATGGASLSAPSEDNKPLVAIVNKTRIVADKRTQTIFVYGQPEPLARIKKILERLDRRTMQVYLATVIGQLNVTDASELSIDILHKLTKSGDASYGSSLRTRSAATDVMLSATTLTTTAAFPVITGYTAYGAAGTALDVFVKALESTSRFKILSRPMIFTANNKKAKISSGQEVPVPASTLSSVSPTATTNSNVAVSSSVEYKKVELSLEVIPVISPEREVTLQIIQKNQSLQGTTTISGNAIPNVSTQELTTTVTVPDRSAVLLGGLITESHQKNETGIPILMDIPVLGYLFKGKTDTTTRSELVILLQPTVIDSEEMLKAYQEGEAKRGKTLDEGRKLMEYKIPMPTTSNPPKVELRDEVEKP